MPDPSHQSRLDRPTDDDAVEAQSVSQSAIARDTWRGLDKQINKQRNKQTNEQHGTDTNNNKGSLSSLSPVNKRTNKQRTNKDETRRARLETTLFTNGGQHPSSDPRPLPPLLLSHHHTK
mmetsp:Transcript_23072/g.74248  ORF Transcript_23072/g.74248 Transcript_23072/m.74248 type:complete len:120 (-) Transcript_23072:282-641(-)